MDPQKETSEQQAPPTAPAVGILNEIFSDPGRVAMLRSLLSSSAASGAAESDPSDTENAPTTPPTAGATAAEALPTAAAPIGDGLGAVLSDPQLMAKLPQMMQMLAPMMASGSPQQKPPHARSTEECRNDLLLALKPFLSQERRNAVDTMLRISKLGTVLRQIK